MPRTFGRTIVLAVTLFALCLAARAADAPPLQVVIGSNGGFAVGCDREPIMSASYPAWGPNWKYAAPKLNVTKSEPDECAFAGVFEHDKKRIDFAGSIVRKGNSLAIRYEPKSEQEFDLIGVCMEIAFDLRPVKYEPSLTYTTADGKTVAIAIPEKRKGEPIWAEEGEFKDRRDLVGWEWKIAGRRIAAKFSRPLGAIPLDRRGGENAHSFAIRHFFVADKMTKDAKPLEIELTFPEDTVFGGAIRESFDPDGGMDDWTPDALSWEDSPVDLSFLNEPEKPAGKRGFLSAKDGKFVFGDGTPARFWAANVAAYAIYSENKDLIKQAAKRISKLGYNLIRLHHQDSAWVSPRVFDVKAGDTQTYDAKFWDSMDYWIACLKEEGIYVHLDIHVGRNLKPGDEVPGYAEMSDKGRKRDGDLKGYCFYNERIQELMRKYQEYLFGHVNPYTKLAYKDDPAIALTLLTNENDLTTHFGNLMLADKGNPHHNKIFLEDVKKFAEANKLDADATGKTWIPGPSKIYLNRKQTGFFEAMRKHLRDLGVKAPVTGTNWCYNAFDLPGMACMDFMDTHCYGGGDPLATNPIHGPNYIDHMVQAHVAGKPFVVSEWNVTVPNPHRLTAQLDVAATSCHQGFDGLYMYNYWQHKLGKPERIPEWGSAYDPALTGMAIPAALLYRRGDVSLAKKTVAVVLDKARIYDQASNAGNMPALRTGMRLHRVLIALEKLPEGVKADEEVGPEKAFLEETARNARTDTGEIHRDWKGGAMLIDTPRSQAAMGWIGGKGPVKLADVTVALKTKYALACVQSLDGAPLASAKKILLTVGARVGYRAGKPPFLSEPVEGEVLVKNSCGKLAFYGLGPKGEKKNETVLEKAGDSFKVPLKRTDGTHWFVLEAKE